MIGLAESSIHLGSPTRVACRYHELGTIWWYATAARQRITDSGMHSQEISAARGIF